MPTTDPSTDLDLQSLEDERSFLLRSLADLDAEHEVGDIDERDYVSLTNDYTARAAAVLRAIEARQAGQSRMAGPDATRSPRTGGPPRVMVVRKGVRTRPAGATAGDSARGRSAVSVSGSASRSASGSAEVAAALARRRRWRNVAVVGAVLCFAGLSTWALARASGSRAPNQTITGNGQLVPETTATTVAGGVDPRLVAAVNDVNKGDDESALKLFNAVLQGDPNQPVALAESGWLEAQAGLAANRPDLVNDGLALIVKAEKADPSYADPHYFRGVLLLQAKNDAADAVTELRLYLGYVDPSAPQVPQVQQLLEQAIQAAGPKVPPGPLAATTTTAPTTTTKP